MWREGAELEITLLDRQRGQRVDRAALRRFLDRLIAAEPPGRADRLAVCLVSDRRMRELNRRFRGRDTSTDVLSVPGDGSTDPEGGCHLGDIVISVTRAREQARQRGHRLRRELELLLLHGYLHLLGHDHEKDNGTMMRLQRRLVRRLVDRA